MTLLMSHKLMKPEMLRDGWSLLLNTWGLYIVQVDVCGSAATERL
jgi:hypothetical protein